MKIILVIALILFVLNFGAISQTTEEDNDKLSRANSQLVTKYALREYDDALKFAKIALDLAISIFGTDHVETAKSYKNIGEIYRVKRKYRESAENFQKAYLIYRKDIVRNGELIGKILDSLGTVLALDGKKAEAEPLLLEAASNAETVFGKETKETLPALKTLTSFYIYTKQYDKADDIFLKRYIIYSILEKKKDTTGLESIYDAHLCYMSQHFKGDAYKKRDKAFKERLKAERAKRFGEEPPAPPAKNTIMGGVINGKATFLAMPAYPSNARQLGITGSVSIRVLIDENGKVTSAKGFCGNPIFFAVTEDAARQSKFSPTTLSGTAVKVSGIITYNFSR